MSVLAIVDDLFFASKIREAARHAGATVDFASGEQQALEFASRKPSLVIVDLNLNRLNPPELIGRLRTHPDLTAATILGFFSHVDADLKLRAEQAGCHQVLPRSVFSSQLPEILRVP